jgi:hypothetical protein
MLETRDDVQLLFTDIRMAARATDWTWRERFTLVGRAFFWSSPPVT